MSTPTLILALILVLTFAGQALMLPVTIHISRIILREKRHFDTWRFVSFGLAGLASLVGWGVFAWVTRQPLIAAIFATTWMANRFAQAAAKSDGAR